jgi:hypothetical protein
MVQGHLRTFSYTDCPLHSRDKSRSFQTKPKPLSPRAMSSKLKRPATTAATTWVAAESQDAMAPSPSSLPSTSATVPAQSDARSGGSVIPSPIAIVAPSRAAADKSIPSPFLPSNATAMENKERKLFFFSLDLLRESLRGGYEKGICTRPVLTCFERVWEEDRKRKFVRDQSSRPEAGANPPQRGVTRCWFAPSCHALPTG